jgi:HK97 family phage major capsid protein
MRNVTDLEAAYRAKTAEATAAFEAFAFKSREHELDATKPEATADERAAVQKLTAEAREIKAQLDQKRGDAAIGDEIERLTASAGALVRHTPTGAAPPSRILTLGAQFTASQAYDFIRKGGHRTMSAWRSPSAELFDPRMFAATLTTAPGSGGDLIVPDRRPGILPALDRELTIADLIAPGTTTSNLITYMKETSFVNAADTVLEGAAKPESTLTFGQASDPVRKIAHWLPITEEMLEDEPQTQSYVDGRLQYGVRLAEEDQLLQGSGVAPDIIGVRNRVGVAPPVVTAVDESNADAIYRQMAYIQTTAMMTPDGIVMNAANWASIELMKDDAGGYVAGGPFSGRTARTLWGLPVVLTPAIAANLATVGAWRQAAQVFRHGGIRVEASNSHQDFFIKNLVAIRAEERLALAVYRPGAFGDVTGLK